jgi:copper oxidase (laccase) domain-containing protein
MWKLPLESQVTGKTECMEVGSGIILSTNAAGNMLDDGVRSAFFDRLGLEEQEGALLAPCNSDRPKISRAMNPGQFSADALLTTNPSVFLWVMPGDCPIIFLRDNEKKMIVHLSLSALLRGALERSLRVFRPGRTQVLIGPSIQECCYVFAADHPILRNLVQLTTCCWDGAIIPVHPNNGEGARYRISLQNRIENTLFSRGFCEFEEVPICTCCGLDKDGNYVFPSHRRSTKNGLSESRFMAVML